MESRPEKRGYLCERGKEEEEGEKGKKEEEEGGGGKTTYPSLADSIPGSDPIGERVVGVGAEVVLGDTVLLQRFLVLALLVRGDGLEDGRLHRLELLGLCDLESRRGSDARVHHRLGGVGTVGLDGGHGVLGEVRREGTRFDVGDPVVLRGGEGLDAGALGGWGLVGGVVRLKWWCWEYVQRSRWRG